MGVNIENMAIIEQIFVDFAKKIEGSVWPANFLGVMQKSLIKENIQITPIKGKINDATVIDGDTIKWNNKTIRLYGIDAPEKYQPCQNNGKEFDCGQSAKDYLRYILSGAKLDCINKGKDKWGRIIGQCMADGEDIGSSMVKSGWAIAYRKYSLEYVSDEEYAKKAKIGMWAKDFLLPSDWRKLNKGARH